VSAHTIEVLGNTFTHKDTLKSTFKLWWRGESWKGKYRVGSLLLPRLISYCSKNRLKLLVDGEKIGDVEVELETDYAEDYEKDTVNHSVTGKGGKPLTTHSLATVITPQGYEKINVKPLSENAPKGDYDDLLTADSPYSEMRAEQQHLLPLISEKLEAGYKNIIVECPTGSGKSALSYWLPLVFNTNCYISTPLKGLQKQYIADHPFMASAMGKSNYECALEDSELAELDLQGCNASNAPCRVIEDYQCPHALTNDDLEAVINGEQFTTPCGYYSAYAEGLKNRWFIGNTTYLTAMKLFGKPSLPTRPLLIVDEAHTVPETIEQFCGFALSRKRIARLIHGKNYTVKQMSEVMDEYPFPSVESMRVNTTPETRRSDCIKILLFLRAIAKEVETRLKHRKYKPDEMGDAKAFIQHTTLMMKELQVNWEGWVYQFDDDDLRNQLKVEPLSVADYAEDCFLSLGRQRIFMSGTIVSDDIFMSELGLNRDETVFLRVNESTFPVSKRPFAIKRNGGLMIWNKESQGIQFSDLKKTADVVAEIASHYPNHKGLILPYTDGIESAVVDILSDNHPTIAARLVQHTKNPKEREGVLEDFKGESGNGILISTYANQGYDNKDIKFVIICKLPFLSLGDTKVQLKMKKSEKWYQTKTVQTIMQQYGRAMRSKDDWGHVYLVDAHFSHWYQTRNISPLMPKYVKEALK